MTKVVLSRRGKFKVTIHLMEQYWMHSVDCFNDQHCFIVQDRPDLLMEPSFHHVVDPDLSLTWNGKDQDMMYDITTQQLMIFNDTLVSRTDKHFIKAVEQSLAANHRLEVIEVPKVLVERGWKIVWSPEQDRELVELKLPQEDFLGGMI